ncbi:MAG: RNA polymerase [Aquimarina sp.]|nr:RNA polymerase [Aquimarina sp.]
MNHHTDQYYINRCLEGETNAFSYLVDQYKDFVYTIILRMVKNKEWAEEIAQDVFVKAYTSLANYRGDAKFSTWLYTIAYRKALDALKSVKNQKTIDFIDDVQEGDIGSVTDALMHLELEERKTIIKNSILKLKEDEAALITLYYFEEKSVKEIQDITKISVDNIKIKLYRSRKKLYDYLNGYIQPQISKPKG